MRAGGSTFLLAPCPRGRLGVGAVPRFLHLSVVGGGWRRLVAARGPLASAGPGSPPRCDVVIVNTEKHMIGWSILSLVFPVVYSILVFVV